MCVCVNRERNERKKNSYPSIFHALFATLGEFLYKEEGHGRIAPWNPGSSSVYKFSLFIRPPVYGSNGRSYKMLVMFFFLSPRVLRGSSADRRETLPHDRKLAGLNNPCPKIRGPSPKKIWRPKTCKISVDFIQPPTLIANISGTAQDI